MSEQTYTELGRSGDPGWLEARKTGIGASEIAAVLGESPFKSALQLYAEKTGAVEPDDLSDNEAVFWGSTLEPVVAGVYKERSGRGMVLSGQLLRSAEHPWALSTLDAWTNERGADLIWPLEVKTTNAFRADEWNDGPPAMYAYQIQQQMLVTGASKATIACLIGGQKLVWCDVERDEITIRRIIKAGSEFWRRVQEQDPPAPDGSESAGSALKALYPSDSGEIIELPGELIALDGELAALETRAKETGKRIAEIKQGVQAALGSATKGVLANGVAYSWKKQERAEHTVKASSFRVLRRHAPKGGK